jgi:hypothetical protein
MPYYVGQSRLTPTPPPDARRPLHHPPRRSGSGEIYSEFDFYSIGPGRRRSRVRDHFDGPSSTCVPCRSPHSASSAAAASRH